jgi:hypothetical protein
MNQRILRFAFVGAVVALFTAYQVTSNRSPAQGSSTQHELTPEIRARTLSFAPGVAPDDRRWILETIAKARPEARQLIDAVDGLVTVGTVYEPGVPYVGLAQEGTDDIRLNVAYLDGERKQDRDQSVLHELGHIIDFELVPDDELARLAAQIPSSGSCITAERGDCTAPQERFADTFAKWALRGAVSSTGAGYGVMSPSSLEDWGAPLGLIAAEQTLSARKR